MNRCIQALNWAITAMPTGKAQAALARMYNDMPQSSEKEEDQVVVALCAAVIDGLRHGNWVGHTSEECFEMARAKKARQAARGE